MSFSTIQQKVIPLVLEKHDVIAQAQTGTEKSASSASFVLPILESLLQNLAPYKKTFQ